MLLRERTIIDGLRMDVSAAHFRNQLNLLDDHLPALRDAASSTWPGLEIRELRIPRLLEDDGYLTLEIRDGPFVGELAVMGHGLQMWLQMLWFLVRAHDDQVLVLDEPDVYMHPDLQRRLLRYLQSRQHQIIIATHSVEMMSEVEPDEIVSVSATRRRSRRSRSLADAQKAVALVGSVHNLQLQRLWSAPRVLFLEGQDLDILKRLHRTLCPKAPGSLESSPHMETGGWGGWPIVPVVARFLREAAEQDLPVYCIFDSDYHWPVQIKARMDEAQEAEVSLAIWRVKELENLLLVPTAVHRILAEKHADVPLADIRSHMEMLADGFHDTVVQGFADTDEEVNPRHRPSTCFARARAHVDAGWKDLESKIRFVPGKRYGQALAQWTQDTYGVSLGPATLARHLRREEFDPQLIDVLNAIEELKPIAARV
jgi:AAA domain, putative AbiEii toxin, Type IV TA system